MVKEEAYELFCIIKNMEESSNSNSKRLNELKKLFGIKYPNLVGSCLFDYFEDEYKKEKFSKRYIPKSNEIIRKDACGEMVIELKENKCLKCGIIFETKQDKRLCDKCNEKNSKFPYEELKILQ